MSNTMVVILLMSLLASLTTGCPSPENIHPCTCDRPSYDGNAYVTCANLDNDQDLVKAANSLVRKSDIYSFVIENSVFTYIPSDAFKGVAFIELEIKDTSFMALTDTDVAFEGLEDHLEILLMTNCTIMSDWDWTLFRNLKKLTTLDIVGVNLENLEDLETINITSIIKIAFSHNRISFIHPSAFSNFKELRLLSLDNNFISVVKRSMLPNPALELTDLDLSYNEIEDLPSDIFSNMPQLEYLSIGFNKILVLEEKTFSPVWEKLQAFSAFGNDLRCDCRLTWILEKMYPRDLRAVCSQPPEAKGKNLRDLASKDLWCFH